MKSIDCFKFQGENQQYLATNTQQYEKITKFILSIVRIDHILIDRFPILFGAPFDCFQLGLAQKVANKEQKNQNMMRTVHAYLKLNHNQVENVSIQFQKFLNKHTHLPSIIPFCSQLKVIECLLINQPDLIKIYERCMILKNKLQKQQGINMQNGRSNRDFRFKNKKQSISVIKSKTKISNSNHNKNKTDPEIQYIYWKVQGCILLLYNILKKTQPIKNDTIHYIRLSKQLIEKSLIQKQKVLEIYYHILNYEEKKQEYLRQQQQQYLKYIKIEYQALCNKKTITPAGPALLTKYEELIKKQYDDQCEGYLASQKRQKINEKIKSIEHLQKKRTKFYNSLTYFTFRNKSQPPKINFYTRRNSHTKTYQEISNKIIIQKKKVHKKRKTLCQIMDEAEKQNSISLSNSRFEVNNFYHKLFRVVKKEKILNLDKMESQGLAIEQLWTEKPTPTIVQILIKQVHPNQQNISNDKTYPFDSVNSQISTFQLQKQLTFIYSFSHDIVYLSFKSQQSSNNFQIRFTSQNQNMINEPIIFHNKRYFSCEQLKKQIQLSEFYFELIQQKTEKDLDLGDIQMISSSLYGQEYDPSALSIICLNRVSRALAFWYCTKATKITGSIQIKREIPHISDPLKFSIAFEFLKKYERKQCLKKIGQSRNKTAIYQCFRYLFYGRKMISKGILRNSIKKQHYSFYSLSLESMKEQNFIICPKSSFFSKLTFCFRKFSMKNWVKQQVKYYHLDEILSSKVLTLFLLDNITANYLSSRILKRIITHISQAESQDYQVYSHRSPDISPEQFGIILKVSEDHSKNINADQRRCSNKIINFLSIIKYFLEIYGKSNDMEIIASKKSIIRIQKQGLYNCCEHVLRCGIVLGVIDHPKKFRSTHRFIYLNDFEDTRDIVRDTVQNVDKFYQHVLVKTPYHNKIYKVYKNNFQQEGVMKIFHVRRNLIQRHFKSYLQTKYKTIIAYHNNFLYISISKHSELLCYRLDIYHPNDCKSYTTYIQECNHQSIFEKKEKFQSKMKVDLQSKIVTIGDVVFNIYETFGCLYSYDKENFNKGAIQLVQLRNNKLYCWIINHTNKVNSLPSPLWIHQVEDCPLAYNTNLFSDFARKQHSVSLYNDMFLRLYFKFISWPGLNTYQLDSIQQLHTL